MEGDKTHMNAPADRILAGNLRRVLHDPHVCSNVACSASCAEYMSVLQHLEDVAILSLMHFFPLFLFFVLSVFCFVYITRILSLSPSLSLFSYLPFCLPPPFLPCIPQSPTTCPALVAIPRPREPRESSSSDKNKKSRLASPGWRDQAKSPAWCAAAVGWGRIWEGKSHCAADQYAAFRASFRSMAPSRRARWGQGVLVSSLGEFSGDVIV